MKKIIVPFILVIGLAVSGYGIQEWNWFQGPSFIQVYHAPKVFARRSGDFTANIVGGLADKEKTVNYQLNNGPWIEAGHGGKRVPFPLFNIELFDKDLRPGMNNLFLKTVPLDPDQENMVLEFEYDPKVVQLPLTVNWESNDLDAQDGYWETVLIDGERRVRPKPGFEGYDRVLMVTGAFPGGRRIETSLIFRSHPGKSPYFGFGILPLWGGHPDPENVRPRRGWNFSIVWYYSHYEGIGMEFSYKQANAPPAWISTYRPLELKPDTRYYITAEAWPEFDEQGQHKRYRQRMKWYAEGEKKPSDWMDITDVEGSPLPEGEYGVGLVAHRSQVEFGPVVVTPMEYPIVN